MCFLITENLRGFAPKPPAGTPSLHPDSPSPGVAGGMPEEHCHSSCCYYATLQKVKGRVVFCWSQNTTLKPCDFFPSTKRWLFPWLLVLITASCRMSGTHGELLRGIRQSVRIRQKSRLADTFRQRQQFFLGNFFKWHIYIVERFTYLQVNVISHYKRYYWTQEQATQQALLCFLHQNEHKEDVHMMIKSRLSWDYSTQIEETGFWRIIH